MIINFESPSEAIQKSHVFISYARKDGNKIANKLEANLTGQGIIIWRDRLIKPGVFGTELKAAIDNSFAMIALITPEACKSYWVKCEWCYAISRRNVTIIPAVSPDFDENLFPFELFPMSRIYLTGNYSSSIENLVALLHFARENPPVW
ncbi:MAG TPA: toll/interleukin-1 receptor domain-containing protein [Pyrinomonadaceae bacterium]|jgi:hypothetical protein|nr:toll/interleukin-1 receptor domain-containing protein [Pyrinomonadaceae bacterium]